MMTDRIAWTPELYARVQRYITMGLTYGEIVKTVDVDGKLGLTKNAISGKVYSGALTPRRKVS